MVDTQIPVEAEKIWTAMGLSPQVFPIYYPMGAAPFTDGSGQPSGAAGALARLSRSLSNFPHMFMGLRISNEFDYFGDNPDPSADDIQRVRFLHEWVDAEQTVFINLAQQNITAELLPQMHLTGHDGINWAPFPAPFPMAGANDITVEVRRTTSYPTVTGANEQQIEVTPICRVTILAAVLRTDMRTSPVRRVHQPY